MLQSIIFLYMSLPPLIVGHVPGTRCGQLQFYLLASLSHRYTHKAQDIKRPKTNFIMRPFRVYIIFLFYY